MKKIMFFNRTFFGGGVEKALLDTVKNLDTNKYDITVFVRKPEGKFMQQYLELESEHVHIRKCFDRIKPGKTLFKKIFNAVIIWIAEKCICRFPKIYYMIAIRDKFDIEVAYMHNEPTAIIASSTNKKSKKIAWVHTDLRQMKTWKDYFGTRKKQKKYYQKFDKIICVSELVKNCFEELLGVYPNIDVIFNPVDVGYLKKLSEEKIDITLKNKVICAVGRLSWEKNFDMLIRSHSKLLKSGTENTLWLVGEGPERENLENLARDLGVENSVVFWGFQENPYKYIRVSEFTVLCSIYEGLPVSALETIVLNKPMVSTCEAVKEVFGNYECGLITKRDEDSLAQGMKKLLTDESLYNKCISETYKRSSELTMESIIEKIENIF